MAATVMAHLTQTRKDLLEELNVKTKRHFALSHKFFYEHANKNGQLLARMLTNKRDSLRVHALSDGAGVVHNNTDKIAELFLQYYEKLYNLPRPLEVDKGIRGLGRLLCLQDTNPRLPNAALPCIDRP